MDVSFQEDKSNIHKAKSQQIAVKWLLLCLQPPVWEPSRLQEILPWETNNTLSNCVTDHYGRVEAARRDSIVSVPLRFRQGERIVTILGRILT